MPYSNFTLEEVKEKFTLQLQAIKFFPELSPIPPSEWLEQNVAVCIAEMVTAKKFNDNRGKSVKYIYDIVTSGSLWHFFQMQGDIVLIDPNEYSLLPTDKLLAALKWMARNENS